MNELRMMSWQDSDNEVTCKYKMFKKEWKLDEIRRVANPLRMFEWDSR